MNSYSIAGRKASAGLLAATLLGGFAGQSHGITVFPTNDAIAMVTSILGSGITVIGTPTYTGASGAAGTFTDGLVSGIGIKSGIVLTTGSAALIDNVNSADGNGTSNGGPSGSADLDTIVGGSKNDVATLEFTFQFGDGTVGGDLFFNYVFGSEEYNEFTNSSFNDVFGFFLDGTNVALLADGVTPVSINSINGGNPFGSGASNADLFNNNDLTDGGLFSFEYDGFTDVLSVNAKGLSAGQHTIKLSIADVGDTALDSGVFIEGGTFSNTPTPPGGTVPDGGTTIALLGLTLAGLAGLNRKLKA